MGLRSVSLMILQSGSRFAARIPRVTDVPLSRFTVTHMTPVDTYNAQANYDEIMKGATRNKNLEVTQDALYLFGNGDGGGGPVPPMLEVRLFDQIRDARFSTLR